MSAADVLGFVANGLLFVGILLTAACVAIVVWAVASYARRGR